MEYIHRDNGKEIIINKNAKIVTIIFDTDRYLDSITYNISNDDFNCNYHHFVKNIHKLEKTKIYDIKIIECNDDKHVISYEMPYYERDLLKIITSNNDCHKWIDIIIKQVPLLIKQLFDNNFCHDDIALRNIMIDNNDNLHFIDYDSITKINKACFCKDDNEYLSLVYIQYDCEKFSIDNVMSSIIEVYDKYSILYE